jgi:hypothetical protein
LSSLKRSIIFPLCVFCSRCCTCRLDHLCCYLQKDKPSRSGVHQSNCKSSDPEMGESVLLNFSCWVPE